MAHTLSGIGRICVDHVVCLESYPDRDTKNHIKEHWFQVGGPVPTALVTARRLGGWSASFMGQWGCDTHGDWIREDLAREEVAVSNSRSTAEARTAFAHIWVDGQGQRTIAYSRGRFAPFDASDVKSESLSGCRLLHLDGEFADAALAAAHIVKAGGGLVLMDLGSPKQGSEKVVPLADLLVVSQQCAEAWVGTANTSEVARHFLALGAGAVVQTRGSEGAWYQDESQAFHQSAFTVKAIDTTGAGDVFCGGLIHALLEGSDRPDAVRFACAASAVKCSGRGNRDALPNLEQVLALM